MTSPPINLALLSAAYFIKERLSRWRVEQVSGQPEMPVAAVLVRKHGRAYLPIFT